eukprot:gene3810-2696_t
MNGMDLLSLCGWPVPPFTFAFDNKLLESPFSFLIVGLQVDVDMHVSPFLLFFLLSLCFCVSFLSRWSSRPGERGKTHKPIQRDTHHLLRTRSPPPCQERGQRIDHYHNNGKFTSLECAIPGARRDAVPSGPPPPPFFTHMRKV